jgi:hypothetical protein
MEGGMMEEEGDTSTARQQEGHSSHRLNAFTYRAGPKDGRYELKEQEQHMLYDEQRCYRCYDKHPFGRGKDRCTKPLKTVAPRPLN